MRELFDDVKEAVEETGLNVDHVSISTADESGWEVRGGLEPFVIQISIYLALKAGDVLTSDIINSVLDRAKAKIRSLRREGDKGAAGVEAVGLWVPDGKGGWKQRHYERIEDDD